MFTIGSGDSHPGVPLMDAGSGVVPKTPMDMDKCLEDRDGKGHHERTE
jgi:hypothetical protein